MKPDYSDLISPFPFYAEHIGHVKSPTLKDIWNPKTTWQGYQIYLGLLLLTPRDYGCEENISMFDLICSDRRLQKSYTAMFDFFLEETVLWDKSNHLFFTYAKAEENNPMTPVGMIDGENFSGLCDIILQRCGVERRDYDVDASKIKNKRAMEILNKIHRRPTGSFREIQSQQRYGTSQSGHCSGRSKQLDQLYKYMGFNHISIL